MVNQLIKANKLVGQVVAQVKKFNMLPPYPEMNEEEKDQMWEEIAYEFAKPESLRRKNREICQSYQLIEDTFYYRIRKPEFKKKVVEIALNEAKNWVPELVEVLKEKAITDKSEKSIEMALKYVADIAERLDLTTKGKEISVNDSLMAKMVQTYVDNRTGKESGVKENG